MRRLHPVQLGDMVGTNRRFYHGKDLCWDARQTDGSNVVFKYMSFGREEEAYMYTEDQVTPADFFPGDTVVKISGNPFQNGMETAVIESVWEMTIPLKHTETGSKTVQCIFLKDCKGLVRADTLSVIALANPTSSATLSL